MGASRKTMSDRADIAVVLCKRNECVIGTFRTCRGDKRALAYKSDMTSANRHLPEGSEGPGGLTLLIAGDCACMACGVGGRLASACWRTRKNAAKSMLSKMGVMTDRTLAGMPADGSGSGEGTFSATCRGSSAIKRVAAALMFLCPDCSPGSVSINDASLQAALSRAMHDSFAASCQGSISKRANAERTLSICWPLCSSTDAYRNASYSHRI